MDLPPNALWFLLEARREGAVMAFDRSSAALLVEMSMMQWVGPDRLTLGPSGKDHYDRIVTLYRQRFSAGE
ncbi:MULTISPECIES: hypothetical protein [unclassified Rhizobium]|uniref:hypothetical protein n=1 Tax=unclassified Rhizobium TaxID=2613769 RepID=UPI00160E1641|nr:MULTISPECIES: hypothetical protein [unclassified Rhizobium]MBB3317660.1 hypothetical protein [Rhizobium sp. BK181]MBB3544583.1 hypothetical protein [Rhizobium sp. BK399]